MNLGVTIGGWIGLRFWSVSMELMNLLMMHISCSYCVRFYCLCLCLCWSRAWEGRLSLLCINLLNRIVVSGRLRQHCLCLASLQQLIYCLTLTSNTLSRFQFGLKITRLDKNVLYYKVTINNMNQLRIFYMYPLLI